MKKEKCTAIVLAAGQGKRMGGKVQKQFMMLKDRPVLFYCMDRFQKSPLIDDIILVTSPEMISHCREEIVERFGFDKCRKIIPGGKERYDSVYEGLLACEDTDYVFIHDSARPFITEQILMNGLEGARRTGACVIGMPSKDTVKLSDAEGFVAETPDRSRVWIIQTPQVFSYSLIREAHERMRRDGLEGVTDDGMVVEKTMGKKVFLAEGSYRNIKITTPEDLLTSEAFL